MAMGPICNVGQSTPDLIDFDGNLDEQFSKFILWMISKWLSNTLEKSLTSAYSGVSCNPDPVHQCTVLLKAFYSGVLYRPVDSASTALCCAAYLISFWCIRSGISTTEKAPNNFAAFSPQLLPPIHYDDVLYAITTRKVCRYYWQASAQNSMPPQVIQLFSHWKYPWC